MKPLTCPCEWIFNVIVSFMMDSMLNDLLASWNYILFRNIIYFLLILSGWALCSFITTNQRLSLISTCSVPIILSLRSCMWLFDFFNRKWFLDCVIQKVSPLSCFLSPVTILSSLQINGVHQFLLIGWETIILTLENTFYILPGAIVHSWSWLWPSRPLVH